MDEINKKKKEDSMQRISNRRVVDVYVFDPDVRVEPGLSLVYMHKGLVTDMDERGIVSSLELSKNVDEYNKQKVQMVDEERTRVEGREVKLPKVKDVSELVIRIVEVC